MAAPFAWLARACPQAGQLAPQHAVRLADATRARAAGFTLPRVIPG